MGEKAEFGLYFPMKPIGQELVQRAFEDVGKSMEGVEKTGEGVLDSLDNLEGQAGETSKSFDDLSKQTSLTKKEMETIAKSFDTCISSIDTVGSGASRLRGGLKDLAEAGWLDKQMVDSLIPSFKGLEGVCDSVTGTFALVGGAFETASAIIKFVQIPALAAHASALWATIAAQLALVASNPWTLVLVAASIAAIVAIIYKMKELQEETMKTTGAFQELGEVTIKRSVIPDILKGLQDLRAETSKPYYIDLRVRGEALSEIEGVIEGYIRKETSRTGVRER